MAVECPLCRVAIPRGQAHCPRCGMRQDPLTTAERHPDLGIPDERARPSGRDLGIVVRRGAVCGVGLIAVAAVVAAALRGSSSYELAFENAVGVTGGLTLVLAFLMGGIRLGMVRRNLDLEARMRPESAAAPATRILVAVAGAVPLAVGLLLALVPR